MQYFKKRYYRIIQSLVKKMIQIERHSKNQNLKKAVRSALYHGTNNKDEIKLSINKKRKLLVFSLDWNSKKLFIDEEFDEKILFKIMKILGGRNKTRITFVNIGAHIGSICIPALKEKFFTNLIAFEPVKKNFRLLASNIYLNSLEDKSKLFNLAISNKKNKLKIKKFSNSGDYRVVNKNQKNAEIVKSDILDNYTNNLNKNNTLIFMDVQGHEPMVFLGARKTIRKKIPIVFEFSPNLLKKNWINGFGLLLKNYKYFYNLSDPVKKFKFNRKRLIGLFNNLKLKKCDYTDLLIL